MKIPVPVGIHPLAAPGGAGVRPGLPPHSVVFPAVLVTENTYVKISLHTFHSLQQPHSPVGVGGGNEVKVQLINILGISVVVLELTTSIGH